jgi:CheY-like chemotaxis protein
MHPRVVVAVADDALRHEALTYCRFLASTNTIEALDGQAAERATESPFDLLILDGELPGISIELLLDRFAGKSEGRRRVVLITSRPSGALKHPLVADTLPKPIKIESLLLALDRWRDTAAARPPLDRGTSSAQSPSRQP